jgi:hypothetical protein
MNSNRAFSGLTSLVARLVTPPRQLCFLTADPSLISKAGRSLKAFLSAWGADARVVSFEMDDISGLPSVRPWRSVLDTYQVAALLRDARQRYDRLVALLPQECGEILQDHHNEGVSLFSKALAFLCVCENDATPVFMIVQGPKADTDTYQGLKFNRCLFASRSFRRIPSLSSKRQPEQPLEDRATLISRFDQEAAAEEQRDAHEAVWRRGATRLSGEDILFVLDDDGSGHLMSTGLRVLKELGARGHKPFVLTSIGAVARAVMDAGFAVARLPFVANGREYVLALERTIEIIAALREAAQNHGPGTPEWIFVHTVIPRILTYATSKVIAETILNEIGAMSQPTCVFSINDTLFLPKVVARWGGTRGLRCEVFDTETSETDAAEAETAREQRCWEHFQRTFPASRGELLYVSAVPAQMARAREQLTSILADGKSDIRAVSFYYPTEENLSDISRLMFWRGALNFDEETSLMEDGYRRCDRLLRDLPETHRALLWPIYHECATLLFEAGALLHIHETTTARQCLVVSGDCGDTRAYEGLALSRRLLVDSLPNPPLNPRSYEQLLRRQLAERDLVISVFDQEAAAEAERDAHEAVWRRGATRLSGQDILFVLDDGGAGYLLSTGLSVLKELSARGHKPLVVASIGAVARAVMDAGFAVARLPFVANGREYVLALERTIEIIAALHEAAQSHGPGTPEWMFIHTMVPRILTHVRLQVIAESMLDEIGTMIQPTCVFSMNEAVFLPMVTGRWARARGLSWIAYLNVLISDHPESKFFPADQHLIYGEQGAELLLQAGAAPETVHAVGSEMFDKGYGRNLEADRLAMESLIPAIRGRKLVVVGSEDRPEQKEEIQAILEELTPMQDLHVVLKLHPDDPEQPFRQLASQLEHRDNVTVIPRCDLHALLNVADLLICVRSNIIIEAAIMGTATLVCDFNPELARINMVDEGIALGCWRREDVAAKTRQCLFDEATIRAHRQLTQRGLARFNGPNDGKSCRRVVDFVLDWRRGVLAQSAGSAA